jgi:hypothetical protein
MFPNYRHDKKLTTFWNSPTKSGIYTTLIEKHYLSRVYFECADTFCGILEGAFVTIAKFHDKLGFLIVCTHSNKENQIYGRKNLINPLIIPRSIVMCNIFKWKTFFTSSNINHQEYHSS